MAQVSKACCELPPVTTSKYEPQGKYIKLAGLDVYSVGPTTANRAIIDVYDIFGMASQTIQGADRLASSLKALVLIPDFFKGSPLAAENFPPDTEEKKETIQKFFVEKANFTENKEVLLNVVKEAKENFPSVGSWGAYGLCWGGKLVAMTSAEGTPFKASGQVHPARLEDSEAEKIAIPHILLLSKEDGTPETMKSYGDILKKNPKNYVESYGHMHHGWMGARANLEDEENVKEFTRGYDKLASFFAEHL